MDMCMELSSQRFVSDDRSFYSTRNWYKMDAKFFTESRSEVRFQNNHLHPEILHADEVTPEKKNNLVEVLTMRNFFFSDVT